MLINSSRNTSFQKRDFYLKTYRAAKISKSAEEVFKYLYLSYADSDLRRDMQKIALTKLVSTLPSSDYIYKWFYTFDAANLGGLEYPTTNISLNLVSDLLPGFLRLKKITSLNINNLKRLEKKRFLEKKRGLAFKFLEQNPFYYLLAAISTDGFIHLKADESKEEIKDAIDDVFLAQFLIFLSEKLKKNKVLLIALRKFSESLHILGLTVGDNEEFKINTKYMEEIENCITDLLGGQHPKSILSQTIVTTI